jgi:hypothetical protein
MFNPVLRAQSQQLGEVSTRNKQESSLPPTPVCRRFVVETWGRVSGIAWVGDYENNTESVECPGNETRVSGGIKRDQFAALKKRMVVAVYGRNLSEQGHTVEVSMFTQAKPKRRDLKKVHPRLTKASERSLRVYTSRAAVAQFASRLLKVNKSLLGRVGSHVN